MAAQSAIAAQQPRMRLRDLFATFRPFPLPTKHAGSLSTGESSCEQGKIATESLLNPAGRDDAASDTKPNRAVAGGLAIR